MGKHEASKYGEGSMRPIGAKTSGGKAYEHEKSTKHAPLVGFTSGKGDHRKEK